jgi:hypothetical protein
MVLSNPEGVDANLIGEHALFDDVAERLRLRNVPVIAVKGDIAERIEAEFNLHHPI